MEGGEMFLRGKFATVKSTGTNLFEGFGDLLLQEKKKSHGGVPGYASKKFQTHGRSKVHSAHCVSATTGPPTWAGDTLIRTFTTQGTCSGLRAYPAVANSFGL
jgi:hypothetical protein